MTANKKAKQAARARKATTGEPYALARATTRNPARAVMDTWLTAFDKAGWNVSDPVEDRHTPDATPPGVSAIIGPALMRVDQKNGQLKTKVTFPFDGHDDPGANLTIPSPHGMDYDAGVRQVGEWLQQQRTDKLRANRVKVKCSECDTVTAFEGLFPLTEYGQGVCARCVLRESSRDLPPADPFDLARWILGSGDEYPYLPATWGAHQAFLTWLNPRLGRLMRDPEWLFYRDAYWDVWIWLPDAIRNRVPAFKRFTAGASLFALEDAVTDAHPDWMDQLRQIMLMNDPDFGESWTDEWAYLALAYAVALSVDAIESGETIQDAQRVLGQPAAEMSMDLDTGTAFLPDMKHLLGLLGLDDLVVESPGPELV